MRVLVPALILVITGFAIHSSVASGIRNEKALRGQVGNLKSRLLEYGILRVEDDMETGGTGGTGADLTVEATGPASNLLGGEDEEIGEGAHSTGTEDVRTLPVGGHETATGPTGAVMGPVEEETAPEESLTDEVGPALELAKLLRDTSGPQESSEEKGGEEPDIDGMGKYLETLPTGATGSGEKITYKATAEAHFNDLEYDSKVDYTSLCNYIKESSADMMPEHGACTYEEGSVVAIFDIVQELDASIVPTKETMQADLDSAFLNSDASLPTIGVITVKRPSLSVKSDPEMVESKVADSMVEPLPPLPRMGAGNRELCATCRKTCQSKCATALIPCFNDCELTCYKENNCESVVLPQAPPTNTLDTKTAGLHATRREVNSEGTMVSRRKRGDNVLEVGEGKAQLESLRPALLIGHVDLLRSDTPAPVGLTDEEFEKDPTLKQAIKKVLANACAGQGYTKQQVHIKNVEHTNTQDHNDKLFEAISVLRVHFIVHVDDGAQHVESNKCAAEIAKALGVKVYDGDTSSTDKFQEDVVKTVKALNPLSESVKNVGKVEILGGVIFNAQRRSAKAPSSVDKQGNISPQGIAVAAASFSVLKPSVHDQQDWSEKPIARADGASSAVLAGEDTTGVAMSTAQNGDRVWTPNDMPPINYLRLSLALQLSGDGVHNFNGVELAALLRHKQDLGNPVGRMFESLLTSHGGLRSPVEVSVDSIESTCKPTSSSGAPGADIEAMLFMEVFEEDVNIMSCPVKVKLVLTIPDQDAARKDLNSAVLRINAKDLTAAAESNIVLPNPELIGESDSKERSSGFHKTSQGLKWEVFAGDCGVDTSAGDCNPGCAFVPFGCLPVPRPIVEFKNAFSPRSQALLDQTAETTTLQL